MEKETGEALNDNEIHLKCDRGTQLVNPTSQRVLVIVYRRFGTNYLSHFSRVRQFTFSWTGQSFQVFLDCLNFERWDR
jgi:hypothetical protein